jgi:predicted nucleic acid-binding protein
MTVVVDTSVLIDHLRGDKRARDAMAAAADAGERITASVLTKVEILAGMRPSEATATRRLLDSLDWIEVDDAVAESAGRTANHYLRSHPGVDPVDYVIAATAATMNADLWTRNIKHFPMFSDLRAPY